MQIGRISHHQACTSAPLLPQLLHERSLSRWKRTISAFLASQARECFNSHAVQENGATQPTKRPYFCPAHARNGGTPNQTRP